MKRIVLICSALLLGLTGCVKEAAESLGTFTLKASVNTDAFTKVGAVPGGAPDKIAFTWTKGDAIAVQTSSGGFATYDLVGEGGGLYGEFKGSAAPSDGGVAVFPASAAQILDQNGSLTINLPESYDFSPAQVNALLLASVGADSGLIFKHIVSLFCVELEGVPSGARLVLTADDRLINGEYSVACAVENPSVQVAAAPESSSVTMRFAQSYDLATVYVPVPAGEYPSLNVKVLDEEGNVINNSQRQTTQSKTFSRGIVTCFPRINIKAPELSLPSVVYNMEEVSIECRNIPEGQTAVVDFGDGTETTTINGSGSLTHKFVNNTGSDQEYVVRMRVGEKTVRKKVKVWSLMALTEAVKALKAPSCQDIWVMAHRANTTDKSIPENSIPALNAAIAAGAHVVETDTHLTSDGEVVICHDKTIDRTTTGTGDITAMTLAQIRSYDLKDRNGNATSVKMPTLREFLEAAKGKVYVNLDYSPRTASTAKVMSIVQELGMMEQVFFYCNSAAKVAEVGAIDPKAHAYAWYTDYAALKALPNEHMVQYPYSPDTPPDLGPALSEGLICTVNMLDYVVDTHVEIEKLIQLKEYFPAVRLIQTDVADKLLTALAQPGMPDVRKEFFVSPAGSGDRSGSSWDNAMGMSDFRPLVSSDYSVKIKTQCANLDGAIFRFMEGTYCTTTSAKDRLKIDFKNYGQPCDIMVYGGYDSSSTGTDLSKRNVAANVTKFTGDRNGNGKADSGDTGIFCLDANCNITFDGCTFAHAYRIAQWKSGAFWLNTDVSGAYARLNLKHCRFYDLYDATSPTGGALAYIMNNSVLTAHDCDITGCHATTRGSAFRVDNANGILFLNSCRIYGNYNAGDWGNAIQISNGNLLMNNCTIARNSGRGAAINGKGNWLIVNSTIVNAHVDVDDAYNMAVRNESPISSNSAVIANSIVLFDGQKPGIYINGTGTGMTSGGYNIYNSIGGTAGSFISASTDLFGQSLSGLGMNWNDKGYYQWNGPAGNVAKAKMSDIETLVKTGCDRSAGQFTNLGQSFYDWLQSLETDTDPLAIDQLGNPRDPYAMWPGAYEKNN